MNQKILLLAAVMAAAPGLAAGASVYKWTDENGVTHFGDRQPTGTLAETVNIRTGGSSGGQASRMSPQQQVQELQERQQAEDEQREETSAEEALRKQREANCATARSNLEVIESNARIRVEENGEMRYLTPEEIEEQRKQFEEIASENCGPMEERAEQQ
jgi:hypothetical protein